MKVLITNKHVINYNSHREPVTFYLHLRTGNEESNESCQIALETDWYFHSKQDLCFCYVDSLFDMVRSQTAKEVFLSVNDKKITATAEKLDELSGLEEVVMVGYPIGLWDERNNFPIFRKGYTASHPAVDFNQKGVGLLDIACFPGSSGSPIFILNENGYTDKNGTTYIGGKRIMLLGILFGGPSYNAEGELVISEIPTQQIVTPITPLMTNLGYYIKAEEINEFETVIKQHIDSGIIRVRG